MGCNLSRHCLVPHTLGPRKTQLFSSHPSQQGMLCTASTLDSPSSFPSETSRCAPAGPPHASKGACLVSKGRLTFSVPFSKYSTEQFRPLFQSLLHKPSSLLPNLAHPFTDDRTAFKLRALNFSVLCLMTLSSLVLWGARPALWLSGHIPTSAPLLCLLQSAPSWTLAVMASPGSFL